MSRQLTQAQWTLTHSQIYTASETANRAHLSSSIRHIAASTSDISSESRLVSLFDSMELKKQKTSHASAFADIQMNSDSFYHEANESTQSSFRALNDSLELYSRCSGDRRSGLKRSFDDTEDLLTTNLHVQFSSQSPQSISVNCFDCPERAAEKPKLKRWPRVSNLHSGVGQISDEQFLNSLVPLLQQVPADRQTSVRDKLCRVLLQELSFTSEVLPSPPPESPAWPQEQLFVGTAALQTFLQDARELITSRNCHTQSTPILHHATSNRSSRLEAHFPSDESIHWSQSPEREI